MYPRWYFLQLIMNKHKTKPNKLINLIVYIMLIKFQKVAVRRAQRIIIAFIINRSVAYNQYLLTNYQLLLQVIIDTIKNLLLFNIIHTFQENLLYLK